MIAKKYKQREADIQESFEKVKFLLQTGTGWDDAEFLKRVAHAKENSKMQIAIRSQGRQNNHVTSWADTTRGHHPDKSLGSEPQDSS